MCNCCTRMNDMENFTIKLQMFETNKIVKSNIFCILFMADFI